MTEAADILRKAKELAQSLRVSLAEAVYRAAGENRKARRECGELLSRAAAELGFTPGAKTFEQRAPMFDRAIALAEPEAMRIGPFDIRVALEYQIWEGRTLKYRMNSLDEAIDLADTLWEEDREREERAQYGTGGIGSDQADDMRKRRHEEAF